MRPWLPTRHYLAFSHPEINNHCPRCNTLETTIHILQDCPWAKAVWCQSPSILPLSFFSTTASNLASNKCHIKYTYPRHQLPWKMYFTFLCWHLWLGRNEHTFNNQSHFQSQIIHKAVQFATKYLYLAFPDKTIKIRIPRIIKWIAPIKPFIKLNIDDSVIDNPGMASASGLLSDSAWISGFSINMGITSNNIAELGAV